jgi:hypothetical protein
MIARLVHAVRYVVRGTQPPDPDETARNRYFIELGRTGCMLAATEARNAVTS